MPIRRNWSLLAAGEKIEIRRPARVTTLGAASLGRAPRDHHPLRAEEADTAVEVSRGGRRGS
jgi:hypothetical protein